MAIVGGLDIRIRLTPLQACFAHFMVHLAGFFAHFVRFWAARFLVVHSLGHSFVTHFLTHLVRKSVQKSNATLEEKFGASTSLQGWQIFGLQLPLAPQLERRQLLTSTYIY